MIEVIIKGNKQLLFAKGETIPVRINDGQNVWEVSQVPNVMNSYINNNNDVRIVIARTIPEWGDAYIFYVYWYENDFVVSDSSLAKHSYYFLETVVLEYGRRVCGDGCQKWWHTLLMPRGTILAANPTSLNWDKVQEGKVSIQNCPECGSSFRQPVIKVLKEAEAH